MIAHSKKVLAAALAVVALGAAACSSGGSDSGSSSGNSGGSDSKAGTLGTGAFAECSTKPNTCNSGTAKQGGTVTYTIEKTISGWNLNLAASNTFDYAEVLDSVLPSAYTATPDLKPKLLTDYVTSATQTSASPQTLVYKINPKAVWSDGTPIDVTDFQYLANISDQKKCPDCAVASTSGYDQIKSITGSDGGKTVTVVMSKPFSDWQYMFSNLYPAHIAKQHGDLNTAAGLTSSGLWLDKNQPTYSGGPYIISNYTKDTSITLSPNPKWWGEKPKLSKLVFRILTDQTQEPTALQNDEVQVIYPQPNQDLVDNVNKIQGVQTYLGKGLTWEHLDMNTKNEFLSDKTLRTAIFTAISRDDIIRRTVGLFVPGIKPLNSRFYQPDQDGYTDNVTSSKQGTGDVSGAKKLLTDAGYTGVGSTLKTKAGKAVSFRCTYSAGNLLRQQTCQVVQNRLKQLGVNVKLVSTPDLSVLDKHDFDLIIFAWVGTPFVASGGFQILYSKSASNFTQNSDAAADKLMVEATTQTDATKSKIPGLLNQADKLLTADAVELPLFQKPTFLAAKSTIVNIRDNATSVGPPYNAVQWGLKG